MSAEATFWAWKQRIEHTGTKFVLLALADHANHENRCWPSVDRLSEKTGMSERSVREALATLREIGLVRSSSRFNGDGSQTSSDHFLMVTAKVDPPAPSAPPPCAERTGEGAGGAPKSTTLNLLTESPPNPKMGKVREDNGFDDFWNLYPRSNAKRAAERAWRNLTLGDRATAMSDLPLRLRGKWGQKSEVRFVPYACKYLNQQLWLDPIEPPRSGAPSNPYDHKVMLKPGVVNTVALAAQNHKNDLEFYLLPSTKETTP